MDNELDTATKGKQHANPDIDSEGRIAVPDDSHQDPKPTPHKGSKQCSHCHTPRDVLIRCQTDSTGTWHFICTGKCWKEVSGGVVDGDGNNQFYRYGGMWKNKHEGASAKIKGSAKVRNKEKAKEEKSGGKGKKGKKARAERKGDGDLAEEEEGDVDERSEDEE